MKIAEYGYTIKISEMESAVNGIFLYLYFEMFNKLKLLSTRRCGTKTGFVHERFWSFDNLFSFMFSLHRDREGYSGFR